jgi:hypothetical protein
MILFAMGGLVGGIVLFGRGLMAYPQSTDEPEPQSCWNGGSGAR